jgi:energy-converting hydrogenase A subunit M
MHLDPQKKEVKTYQVNSNLNELLNLFSNGDRFYRDVDDWIFNNESDTAHGYTKDFIELAEQLNIDEDELREIFYENVCFTASIEQIAINAIESYIEYKIARNSDVDITLELTSDDKIIATIKTHRTLDSILHEGMEAYGDFDYNGHSEEDKDSLKNDFYYILKYLIYYYIACNGGSIKPYLKIEEDLDHYWDIPTMFELEEKCKKLIKDGQLKVLDV